MVNCGLTFLELGVRIRKVVAVFVRLFNSQIRDAAKKQMTKEKSRIRLEKEKIREREFSKRDRQGIFCFYSYRIPKNAVILWC